MNRVREGETLIVTHHNKPIAELRPIGATPQPGLVRLVAEGSVVPPRAPIVIAPIELEGWDSAQALDETRADRDL